jgi:hypothetical protein
LAVQRSTSAIRDALLCKLARWTPFMLCSFAALLFPLLSLPAHSPSLSPFSPLTVPAALIDYADRRLEQRKSPCL